MITGLTKKIKQKGFTLVELLVAILIFSIIVVGILSVFVSSASAYQKAQAMKSVRDNMEYAMNSIAKDVRMGKIDATSGYSNGSLQNRIILTRNTGGKVCYSINATTIGVDDSSGDCTNLKNLVDLSTVNMSFDLTSSGFFSCPSTLGTPTICPTGSSSANRRGWVEINFNVNMTTGKEMSTDQINVQTIVSSRDYGWQEVAP